MPCIAMFRRIPEMNIPVPPFAKGGLGGIRFEARRGLQPRRLRFVSATMPV